MLRALFVSALAAVASAMWGSSVPKLKDVPATVPVNVPQYLGRWYQMYMDAFVAISTERGTVCATADYGLNPNGTISVYNKCRINSGTGTKDGIQGYAYATSQPGQLVVHLDGVPVNAPYWVLALGPVENNLYQWAVVSDPFRVSLFVLARDVADFQSRFQATVLSFLSANGFNGLLNSPLVTPQVNCTYW